MAAALTLVAATPYALKYEWGYDGTGGVGSGAASRTQAQMIADFANVPGPSALKALLSGVPSDGDWENLDHSAQISLYQTISNLPLATSVASEFTNVLGPGRVLSVVGKDGNPGRAIIEIRFHHTIDR